MAIIEFDPNADLQAQKAALLEQIAQLDAREPEDMESEEYEEILRKISDLQKV